MEQEKKFYTLIVFSENFAGLLNQVTPTVRIIPFV